MSTNLKSISKIYANSLFAIAGVEKSVENVEGELNKIRELLKKETKMTAFLKDKTIKPEGKKSALLEILGEKSSPLLINYLNLVIDQGREGILLEMIEEFFLISSSAAGKVYAYIVTAVPLSSKLLESVKKKLTEEIKKEVVLKPSVDESIAGGMMVRVGDKIIDASIRKQLDELRKSIRST